MTLFFLAVLVGFLSGIYAPDEVRAFFHSGLRWVRGAWGWASDHIVGVNRMVRAPSFPSGISPDIPAETERVGLVGGAKPARINKLFSFALPIPGPFGLPWKLIACVAVVAAILGALYFFGEARYAQGVSAEKARWERRIAEANREMARASAEIGAERREAQRALSQALATGSEQIHAAVISHETRDLFLAWAQSDRGLCDASGGCGSDGG